MRAKAQPTQTRARGPGRRKGQKNRNKEQILQEATECMKLRIAGASFESIYQALKSTFPQLKTANDAWRAVQRAMKLTSIEPPAEYVEMEVHRMDRLQQAMWPKALAGDTHAASVVLRISARRDALYGLTRPDVHFHLGGNAAPTAGESSMLEASEAYSKWTSATPILEAQNVLEAEFSELPGDIPDREDVA